MDGCYAGFKCWEIFFIGVIFDEWIFVIMDFYWDNFNLEIMVN